MNLDDSRRSFLQKLAALAASALTLSRGVSFEPPPAAPPVTQILRSSGSSGAPSRYGFTCCLSSWSASGCSAIDWPLG